MSLAKLKENSFEEKDKEKLVKLLNLVHTKIADLNGKEAFEYRDLMAWAQQVLMVKLERNILGDIVVHDIPKSETKKSKKASK